MSDHLAEEASPLAALPSLRFATSKASFGRLANRGRLLVYLVTDSRGAVISSSNERLLAMGWTLLGRLSDLDESFPEDDLLRRVAEIEKTIHSAPNEVRSDMNRALITIGGHSPAMRKAVV